MQVKNLLIQMVGATYSYMAKDHKITGFKETAETIFIATDKGLLELKAETALETLRNDFFKVNRREVPVKSEVEIQTFNQLNAANLMKTLEDTLAIIKDNPKYIAQANAINKTINTFMNLIKTEIAVKQISKKEK